MYAEPLRNGAGAAVPGSRLARPTQSSGVSDLGKMPLGPGRSSPALHTPARAATGTAGVPTTGLKTKDVL